ncbi:MAG: hypothetical protein LBQ89_00445 [Treponema sp.]|jgi:hypothetical protein|nr:hypothetical protein [Treponema sp.]
MGRAFFFLVFLIFFNVFSLSSQTHEQGTHQDVIRGEVYVDLEPIYAGHVDGEYPLDIPTASRRALEETAMFYSAMIYGWSFYYEVGERARQLDEKLEMEPLGSIQFGDPALHVTDSEIRDFRLRVWTDYYLNYAQQRQIQVWSSGRIRSAQAVGYSPSEIDEYPGWLVHKKSALEDAARVALRAILRGSERNRPKEASGFISLASFPRYYMDGGRWAASARFRVQITEIIPFPAY